MPVYDSGISSSVKRFVTYIDETIVVSKMTHEYKLALRRQVRPERGEQEPGTATKQIRAAAEGYNIKNNK